jgi:hypothetical protein
MLNFVLGCKVIAYVSDDELGKTNVCSVFEILKVSLSKFKELTALFAFLIHILDS